MTACAEQKDDT